MKTSRAAVADGMRILLALAFLMSAGIPLAGCEEEGPAEEAGERVDETVEEAEDAAD